MTDYYEQINIILFSFSFYIMIIINDDIYEHTVRLTRLCKCHFLELIKK